MWCRTLNDTKVRGSRIKLLTLCLQQATANISARFLIPCSWFLNPESRILLPKSFFPVPRTSILNFYSFSLFLSLASNLVPFTLILYFFLVPRTSFLFFVPYSSNLVPCALHLSFFPKNFLDLANIFGYKLSSFLN